MVVNYGKELEEGGFNMSFDGCISLTFNKIQTISALD